MEIMLQLEDIRHHDGSEYPVLTLTFKHPDGRTRFLEHLGCEGSMVSADRPYQPHLPYPHLYQNHDGATNTQMALMSRTVSSSTTDGITGLPIYHREIHVYFPSAACKERFIAALSSRSISFFLHHDDATRLRIHPADFIDAGGYKTVCIQTDDSMLKDNMDAETDAQPEAENTTCCCF